MVYGEREREREGERWERSNIEKLANNLLQQLFA